MKITTRRHFVAGAGLAASALAMMPSQQSLGAETKVVEIKKESEKMKKIVVAADPFALSLKEAIVAHLKEKGYEVQDVGSVVGKDVPYFDGAPAACKVIQAKQADAAILFCGTGMGMSIVANRFKGCTAAVVESVYAAKMCRAINNANVLCMGQMIWGEMMAKEAVDAFLNTKFTQGLEGLAGFLQDAAKKVEALRP